MAKIPQDVLYKETNARFWAQTHYKPGLKLSQANPTDRAMMPVWMDVLRKVQGEAAAGKLVLTHDRPEVAQNLADAEIADKAAAAHLDAAAAAPDVVTAQQNVAAATAASQVSAQKVREVAAAQPPTVSSTVSQTAAREASRTPPPAQAPSAEHLAHARAQSPRPSPQRLPPVSPGPQQVPYSPREVFSKEANARFWAQTGYKPGQKLDMTDPTDRKMAKIWMDIFRKVQREGAAGRLVLTSPPVPVPPAMAPAPRPFAPPRAWPFPAGAPRPFPAGAPRPFAPPRAWPFPAGAPRMFAPPRAWPFLPAPAPAPVQMPTAPPTAPATSAPPDAPSLPLEAPPPTEVPPSLPEVPAPSEKPTSVGKIVAIAAAIAAVGGLAIVATRKTSRPSSSYARAPKMFVASPTRVVRASAPLTPMRTAALRE